MKNYLFLCLTFCASVHIASSFADPMQCFGQNEFLDCVHACPPEKTCKNRNILFSCVRDETPCRPKCVCKTGFYRNPEGTCISEEQCYQCNDEHEYFACGSACDNECDNIHTQNKTNCPIKNIKCNDKCYCEDGYARNKNGRCVPISECNPTCQDENEEYTTCKKECPPETCTSLVAMFKCDSAVQCKPGCACKPGFLRKSLNEPCMPLKKCPELANSPDFN